jgi:hypothetical protein
MYNIEALTKSNILSNPVQNNKGTKTADNTKTKKEN